MSLLRYYIRRSTEQSFRETLMQAGQLLVQGARARVQPVYDRFYKPNVSKESILQRSGFSYAGQLAERVKTRTSPRLFNFETDLDKETVLRTADLRKRESLIWNVDLKSGYAWNPKVHYRQIRLAPVPGADIKSPWERSRFHDCVVLGLAYRISRDDSYAEEFVRRLTNWIKQNPCPYGVNWSNAMEAGIRAINWISAFYLMRDARAITPAVVMDLLVSLAEHASFIKSNLEYRQAWVQGERRRLNSNHYLCDLAGLLYITLLFPELQLAEERDFARREIELELFEQTYADGVDYEHSTSYHRFVLEIFQSVFLLLKENGYDIAEAVDQRLLRMRVFLSSVAHPDGTMPQIGDNDSGEVLPIRLINLNPSSESSAFHEGGFYSMRGTDSHVIVSATSVGMHGFGSHSHNDVLSFEYWYGGQAWIVDPGTYLYLSDPPARNWFRSTQAHNTVRIDGQEINPFHDEAIFQMVRQANVQVHKWEVGPDSDTFEAEHNGYARLKNGVRHCRRFQFHKHKSLLTLYDSFKGAGEHLYEWFFQVPPGVNVHQANGSLILSNGVRSIRLRFECGSAELTIIDGWYSPRYGTRQRSIRLLAGIRDPVPPTAITTIEPC